MMNSVVITGRLAKDIEIKETKNGKKYSNLTLAINRPFKNADGIYETDFVDVTVWGNIAESTKNRCEKGSVIGVKGRLETNIEEDKDGNTRKYLNVVCDSVSFIALKKEKNSRDEER